jgi:hypothetical protein
MAGTTVLFALAIFLSSLVTLFIALLAPISAWTTKVPPIAAQADDWCAFFPLFDPEPP